MITVWSTIRTYIFSLNKAKIKFVISVASFSDTYYQQSRSLTLSLLLHVIKYHIYSQHVHIAHQTAQTNQAEATRHAWAHCHTERIGHTETAIFATMVQGSLTCSTVHWKNNMQPWLTRCTCMHSVGACTGITQVVQTFVCGLCVGSRAWSDRCT